jgi:hypothetical protein
VRPRDHNILARAFTQQLMPRRRSCSRVDVEDHRHLGVLQLDALCMDDVAPGWTRPFCASSRPTT